MDCGNFVSVDDQDFLAAPAINIIFEHFKDDTVASLREFKKGAGDGLILGILTGEDLHDPLVMDKEFQWRRDAFMEAIEFVDFVWTLLPNTARKLENERIEKLEREKAEITEKLEAMVLDLKMSARVQESKANILQKIDEDKILKLKAKILSLKTDNLNLARLRNQVKNLERDLDNERDIVKKTKDEIKKLKKDKKLDNLKLKEQLKQLNEQAATIKGLNRQIATIEGLKKQVETIKGLKERIAQLESAPKLRKKRIGC